MVSVLRSEVSKVVVIYNYRCNAHFNQREFVSTIQQTVLVITVSGWFKYLLHQLVHEET